MAHGALDLKSQPMRPMCVLSHAGRVFAMDGHLYIYIEINGRGGAEAAQVPRHVKVNIIARLADGFVGCIKTRI